ncbi:MAG: hypothetical protein L6R41_004958 [Letrouitia leprolyta]|nr:MAG: hypothetical protein L6R41_004958 [Letrouitia leprolyta]
MSSSQGPDRSELPSADILISPPQAHSASGRRGLESRLNRLAEVVISAGALEDHGPVSMATPNDKTSGTSRSTETSTASLRSIEDSEATVVPFAQSGTSKARIRRKPCLGIFNTRHDEDTTTMAVVDEGNCLYNQNGSALPSSTSNNPSSQYSLFTGRHSSPGSNDSDSITASSRANENSTAKEKYLEASELGNISIFRERLRAAQNMHIISQSALPAPDEESRPSPFGPQSPIAWDLFPRQTTNSTNTLGSARQLRERQKADADQAALAQHSPGADYHDVPRTISPKESMLEHDLTEERPVIPAYLASIQVADAAHQHSSMSSSIELNGPPQSLIARRPAIWPRHEAEVPRGPAISQEFMAYTSVSTTSKSLPENSAWLDSLSAARSTQGSRLSEMHECSGSYACVYQGCTARFKSAAGLQRHRREDHRGLLSRPSSAVPTRSSTTNPNLIATPPRVWFHKCERISPSTGKPCNTIFSRSYDLTRHEDTIHNVRKEKVKCHMCTEERTFARNDALTRHMRITHPEVDWPSKTKRRGDDHMPNHLARTSLGPLLNQSHDNYELPKQPQSTSECASRDKYPEFPVRLVSMEDSPKLDRTMSDIYQDELYSPRVL